MLYTFKNCQIKANVRIAIQLLVSASVIMFDVGWLAQSGINDSAKSTNTGWKGLSVSSQSTF